MVKREPRQIKRKSFERAKVYNLRGAKRTKVLTDSENKIEQEIQMVKYSIENLTVDCFENICQHLRIIDLINLMKVSTLMKDHAIYILARKCKVKPFDLVFNFTQRIYFEKKATCIRFNQLTDMLKVCSNLKSLQFIRDLHWRKSQPATNVVITFGDEESYLIEKAFDPQTMIEEVIRHLRKFEKIVVDPFLVDSKLFCKLVNMSTLKSITMMGNRYQAGSSREQLSEYFQILPNDVQELMIHNMCGCFAEIVKNLLFMKDLTSFEFIYSKTTCLPIIPTVLLTRLFTYNTKLRSLRIEMMDSCEDDLIFRQFHRFRFLTTLDISCRNMVGLNDDTLIYISTNCPMLEDVTLAHCPGVQGHGITALFEGLKNLTSFKLQSSNVIYLIPPYTPFSDTPLKLKSLSFYKCPNITYICLVRIIRRCPDLVDFLTEKCKWTADGSNVTKFLISCLSSIYDQKKALKIMTRDNLIKTTTIQAIFWRSDVAFYECCPYFNITVLNYIGNVEKVFSNNILLYFDKKLKAKFDTYVNE